MKRSLLFILLILVCWFHAGDAQDGGKTYRALYAKAEQLYNSENPTAASDSLAFEAYNDVIQFLEKRRQHDSMLLDSYTKSAVLKQMKGDDSIAIQLFNRGLKIASGVNDTVKFLPLLYCGTSYYLLNQFDSASYYYERAEDIADKYPHIPERERLYNKIGTLYYEEGNFYQGLNYFRKALSLLDTTVATNNFLLVNYYNNIAVTLKKLGRYQEALDTYRRMLPYRINQDGLMHNIATVYLDLQQPAEALKFLHMVGTRGQQHYNNLALAHLQTGQTDSASFFIEKAFNSRTHRFKTTVNGLTWYYLGRVHQQKQQYYEALKAYHRSIIELDPDFFDTTVANNPTQFKGLHSFNDLFNAFAAKARIQRRLYKETKQTSYLEQSLNTWEAALLLARTVQQGYDAEESRLFLNNNLQPASEEAVETALELQDTRTTHLAEKIFQLAETSKAAVLQIRLRQSSLASLPGMPAHLLSEQKKLQLLIARMQVQYEQTTDTVALTSLQQQVRDLEIRLSEVNEQLNDDPNYIAARSETEPLTIKDLQQSLPDDMSVLSYYLIRDRWLAFVLDKRGFSVNTLPMDSAHMQLLQTVRQQLSSPNLSYTQLQPVINDLHNWLVEPLMANLRQSRRLMIIPDHDLQYIPFEILAGKNGKRLQEDFAISYNYSAVFAAAPTSGGTVKVAKKLGIAPFVGRHGFDYPKPFSPLPASEEEVRAIKGDWLTGASATKQAFEKMASSYSVIHLATHASANDREPQNSFIAFFPSGADTSYKLFQPEIYTLDLHAARLVILSACETGHGQFVHGEGMMSLARAFSYAGCKSVITSLWKADDAATAYITRRLHRYLQKGEPKDIALQKAKQDYLEDSSIPDRLKVPAYWSHLVMIGDTAPFRETSALKVIAPIIVAAVLLVVILLIVRRRK